MAEPLTQDDMDRAVKRTSFLSELIGKLPWLELDHVLIRWNDDREETAMIGSADLITTREPTFEVIHIEIVAKPGALPVPRREDNRVNEGEVIL